MEYTKLTDYLRVNSTVVSNNKLTRLEDVYSSYLSKFTERFKEMELSVASLITYIKNHLTDSRKLSQVSRLISCLKSLVSNLVSNMNNCSEDGCLIFLVYCLYNEPTLTPQLTWKLDHILRPGLPSIPGQCFNLVKELRSMVSLNDFFLGCDIIPTPDFGEEFSVEGHFALPSVRLEDLDELLYPKAQNQFMSELVLPVGDQDRGSHEQQKLDHRWFSLECKQRFPDYSTAPGQSMMAKLYNALSSGRDSRALQNELFELTGGAHFDFLELLLLHRQSIVDGTTAAVAAVNKVLLNSVTTASDQRAPSFGPQVTIVREDQKQLQKRIRKMDRALSEKVPADGVNYLDEDEEYVRALGLHPGTYQRPRMQRNLPFALVTSEEVVCYPHVYDQMVEIKQSAALVGGAKMMLPEFTVHKDETFYEEFTIPANKNSLPPETNNLISVNTLDEVLQKAFHGVRTLNRIQSIVYPTAYNTSENMLVCAPTGAGKTNIALLSICQIIKQFQDSSSSALQKEKFKIIYVAPMKALASEMTANFSRRLQPFGICVRELTGDMQLSRGQIASTQMLVVTPEKWDVVTRKSTADTALVDLVKLLIIDEVHLLNDDRGPVIESIVARTLRMVEFSQKVIRIVGLSATLPNYVDVAKFIGVNPNIGLFYFDGRFRPVPLTQTFIGIKKAGVNRMNTTLEDVCYLKAAENLKKGHQVIVFVHSRDATLKTAYSLRESAIDKGDSELFSLVDCSNNVSIQKQIEKTTHKQLATILPYGLGIHHAGLQRKDRNLVESLFMKGHIRCLVSTATLAWGVNLPAHAVIIKSTEVYDASKGCFTDIGILDVMQVFGRAGRPQFDSEGHGYIITKHDKLAHYLAMIMHQAPIESRLLALLADCLNAEIALGTVASVGDGISWLRYTYLNTRMHKNPLLYGLSLDDFQKDPELEKHRRNLIIHACKLLDKARMVRFDANTEYLFPTDLGRIASHYYIKYSTVELINEKLSSMISEEEVFDMVSSCSEFSQIKLRNEETDELEMLSNCLRHNIKGGACSEHGKINILMQNYVTKVPVDCFSLVSDMAYIAQNTGRIMRALFEITLHRHWALAAQRLLRICKCMEKRVWDFDHPFQQVPDVLSNEMCSKLGSRKLTIERIKDMHPSEIGAIARHQALADRIKKLAHQFPSLQVASEVKPVTRTVLRLHLSLTPDYEWDDRLHGTFGETWWVWVEDPDSDVLYHHESVTVLKKHVRNRETINVVFAIPIFEPLPAQYIVHVISDHWLHAEVVHPLDFKHLILPQLHPPHTNLLDLDPLPCTALDSMALEMLYPFTHFNPIQTQVFHTLYHTDKNVLLGAPTGSGKTVVAELAIFRVFRQYPKSKVVYIAPLKALVHERMVDWKARIEERLGKRVVELTGDVTPDVRAITGADLIVTTPEKWDGISRSWQTRAYVRLVAAIIIDEIHLLGDERGPVLEVIVSRSNFIASHSGKNIRIVGLSTAMANAHDLAMWLNVDSEGMFNFRPSVRPVPLEVHIKGFQGKHYCPRMATMNKPAFKDIQMHSPNDPVLIFVSSRRQTRLTAVDLVTNLTSENSHKQWVHMPMSELYGILEIVQDESMKNLLQFGVGIHHAGLKERDRCIVEELFVNRKIQVLVATSTLAWGVNFPAHLVIIKGTEYYDGKTHSYVDFPITDVLQMMGRAGRPQFDSKGVAVVYVHDIKKNFYKKFLYEPFPVESNLLSVLPDHINAEVVAGTITTKQDAIDYLTWTYLYRRLLMNPSYYGMDGIDPEHLNVFLSQIIYSTLIELMESYCIDLADDEQSLVSTVYGKISSFYYISNKTVRGFRQSIGPSVQIQELLMVLVNAKEFDTFPVRHNEDIMNSELARSLPISMDQSSFGSPHTKAHLLLQAHFCRLPLPIADYITDTKSVLDQSIRVLQAMIDLSAAEGWLTTCLYTVNLLQMVVQGMWITDSPFLQLPHVDALDLGKVLRNTFNRSTAVLPDLLQIARNDLANLKTVLGPLLKKKNCEELLEALMRMPTLDVSLSVARSSDSGGGERSTPTALYEPNGGRWVSVQAEREQTLTISLNRWRQSKTRGNSAYTPRFPKPKDEGWILILGDADRNELIALKRVGCVADKSFVNMAFSLPQDSERSVLSLYIMSDCYIGFDQQYDLAFEVI